MELPEIITTKKVTLDNQMSIYIIFIEKKMYDY